jgi:hypothetical protein
MSYLHLRGKRRAFRTPLVWIVGAFALADILCIANMPIALRCPVAAAAFVGIVV